MEPGDPNRPPQTPQPQPPAPAQGPVGEQSTPPSAPPGRPSPAPPLKPPRPARPAAQPREELLALAERLGLDLPTGIPSDALIEAVESRRRLVESLPAERLAEIAAWAGIATRDADRIELARRISHDRHTKFAGLGTEALRVLAMLRGCEVEPDDDREALRRKIKRTEGFFQKFRRKRRALVARMIGGVFADTSDSAVPEERRQRSLKERIEDEGVVSAVKGKLRGAADDYVREKLDEIEARIDHKLDEIDRRLAEWRDREIANRMKIIRITLFASVVVALLSLAYTWLRSHFPGHLP